MDSMTSIQFCPGLISLSMFVFVRTRADRVDFRCTEIGTHICYSHSLVLFKVIHFGLTFARSMLTSRNGGGFTFIVKKLGLLRRAFIQGTKRENVLTNQSVRGGVPMSVAGRRFIQTPRSVR